MEGRILTPLRAPQRATTGLGARLRQLRIAAGLTQSELAGDRFSKEYVSQIERGKTRPTKETLAWIAERLGVDVSYLETGQSWDEYAEAEASVVRAEAAVEGQRFDEALEALEGLQHSPEAQELEFRARLAEGWARVSLGELRPALDVLMRARELSEQTCFSDVERADVLYHLGVCRYKLTSINTAQNLFSEALDLADRSGLPCDRLRSHILQLLALEGAEAFAELLHEKIRTMWGIGDAPGTTMGDLFKAKYRGVRVSFGYPACPRLEDQAQLFRLLGVEEHIGVNLTEGFMMEPEGSVTALVFHHPDAKYFSLSPDDTERLERALDGERVGAAV